MQGGEWDGGVPPLPPSLPLPNSELLPSFPQTGNRPSMAAAAVDDTGALPPLPFMSGNVVTGDRERTSGWGGGVRARG